MIDHNSIKRFRFEAAEYTNEIKPLGTTKWNEIRDMKFAELIVKECADLANEGFGSANFGLGIKGKNLKEHFGVQE